MNSKYQSILSEYSEVQKKLSETTDGEQLRVLGKREREMGQLVSKIREFDRSEQQIAENEKLLSDAEFKKMAEEEIAVLTAKIVDLKSEIDSLMLPRDPLDEKNAILEIRAAAGGDESALFGAELFRMYQKYSESKGWKFFILSSNRTSVGGFKEGLPEIRGMAAYGLLK